MYINPYFIFFVTQKYPFLFEFVAYGRFIILSTCEMKIVSTKTKQISLNGITLFSHIDLFNPHETYSVSYSIQANEMFQFFPSKGIIMALAQQIITVKYAKKPTLYQLSNFEKQNNFIAIQVFYDNELNKKIKKNYSKAIWKQLKHKKQILTIPITISPQHKQLKSRLSSTLNMNTHNQSRALTIKNISVDVSSIGKVQIQEMSNQSINCAKMKALIDSSEQNLPLQSRQDKSGKQCSIQNLMLIQLENSEAYIEQSPRIKLKRFINIEKSNKQFEHKKSKDPQYLLQILVLMIISGFFIALGSNIKSSIF